MNGSEHLRPIERRILHMRDNGLTSAEIAQRVRRSAEHVERMLGWTEIPRTRQPSKFAQALESRVLALRNQGLDHDEIAKKFRRSARNIRHVEALAYYRHAIALLRTSD
jgi:transcriptional regulator